MPEYARAGNKWRPEAMSSDSVGGKENERQDEGIYERYMATTR
jgi:hypothetical protein